MGGALTGGLRDRMIIESVGNFIEAHLATLGWFDESGRHHGPITVIDEFPDDDAQVELNTLAISSEGSFGRRSEMGSTAEEHYMNFFFDFFAESDALGRHFTGDIYAFLQSTPVMPVYDYRQATPPIDFYVGVEDDSPDKRKPPRSTNPWQKHWYTVSFSVTDDRENVVYPLDLDPPIDQDE